MGSLKKRPLFHHNIFIFIGLSDIYGIYGSGQSQPSNEIQFFPHKCQVGCESSSKNWEYGKKALYVILLSSYDGF